MDKHNILCCNRIVSEVNKYARKKANLSLKKKDFEKALLAQNTTIENKKKRLLKCLHALLVTTFAINPRHVNKKTLEHVKARVAVAREIIQKIKSLNNYVEEFVLHELGVVKKPLILKAVKQSNPEKYLKSHRNPLDKKDLLAIEETVYKLMQEIVLFDDALIKKYKQTESSSKSQESMQLKDLHKSLNKQSECLEVLEAKIPPASKVTMKMFQKKVFQEWVPRVFALLATLEAEYKKETIIFANIKKNKQLRKKIDSKIKHIIEEKQKMLKIREKRALDMDATNKIQDEFRHVFHQYVSASRL